MNYTQALAQLAQVRAENNRESEDYRAKRTAQRLESLVTFRTWLPPELHQYARLAEESDTWELVVPGCDTVYFRPHDKEWVTYRQEVAGSSNDGFTRSWREPFPDPWSAVGRAHELFKPNLLARAEQERINAIPPAPRKLSHYEKAERIIAAMGEDDWSSATVLTLAVLALVDTLKDKP